MARDDWFRNKSWNTSVEKRFFEKLARARSQRDQYLAIQALTIAPRDPTAAIRLVGHYFDTRKDNFHDVQALLARADAQKTLGDTTGVIATYKEILTTEAKFPRHKTSTHVDFPYLVAAAKIEEEYDHAVTVLDERREDVAFPLDLFKWHASYALISSARGHKTAARDHAVEAIAAAEMKRSGFRFHQNLGLVGKKHKQVVKNLIHLATG